MNTHHNKTKVNPLVDWYQRTTGNFVDRMCCVSYSSQVDDGEIPVEYDEEMRAKIVTPQWIKDYEEEEHAKRKGCKEHGGRGHLSLHGENDCTGKCFFSQERLQVNPRLIHPTALEGTKLLLTI